MNEANMEEKLGQLKEELMDLVMEEGELLPLMREAIHDWEP